MGETVGCDAYMRDLRDVLEITGRYHGGLLTERTCYYLNLMPSDRVLGRLMESLSMRVLPERKGDRIEAFEDEEVQELVGLYQGRRNQLAAQRLLKLFEPVIWTAYRKVREKEVPIEKDEFYVMGVIKFYDYLRTYEKGRADFSYIFRKRLCGIVSEIREERYPFSTGLGQVLARVKLCMGEFEALYGRLPTETEIAERCRCSVKSARNYLWIIAAQNATRLDHPARSLGRRAEQEESYSTLGDLLVDPRSEEEFEDRYRREIVLGEVMKLPELERRVVFARFGFFEEPCTIRQLCVRFQFTPARINRIMDNAFDILRLTLRDYG